MYRLYPLLITITITIQSTITLKKPIQIDYYKEKLNQIFLDHNNQLWFDFVKSIEILNPKTTICKIIPYQFESMNPVSISFENITSTIFDNEQKTLFVLEQKQLTMIQIIFTNYSLSTYHFRNGQANYIRSIETSSYNITNGIALAQLEENFVFILNSQQKLILFDKITKNFEEILQFQSQPIWITCANSYLFVGFEDKMIQYTLDQRKLKEIHKIELILKETSILMIQQSSIFIQFPFYKVIKIAFSQNVLQLEDYLNQNMEIKSLTISGQKISYLTKDYVYLNSGQKLFEQYDKLVQFDDLIILISNKGIHKVLYEFSDELSFPLYIRHQNVNDVHFMNNFGINYHLITRSQNLIQINEISLIESFISCDDRIGDNQEEALSFMAFADGCHDRNTISPAISCKFEGKLQFNSISTIYSKFSDLTYVMIIVIIIASILILLAIFYTRKYQKQAEQYKIIEKDIPKLDQSKDQINQEKEY